MMSPNNSFPTAEESIACSEDAINLYQQSQHCPSASNTQSNTNSSVPYSHLSYEDTNDEVNHTPQHITAPHTTHARCPLHGQEYYNNPYPLYDELISQGPIHPIDFPALPAWLVTGYEPACDFLRSAEIKKDHQYGNQLWHSHASIMPEPLHSQLQVHLLHRDPPKHTVMRAVLLPYFSPRRLEKLRPRITQIIAQRISNLPPHKCEFISDCAFDLAFEVLSLVIGLPDQLRVQFDRNWASVVKPIPPGAPGRNLYLQRLSELQGYIRSIVQFSSEQNLQIAHKNSTDTSSALNNHIHEDSDGSSPISTPQRDAEGNSRIRKKKFVPKTLLGEIIYAADTGSITESERDSLIFQLLAAGAEPVCNQLTMCLLTLLRNDQQRHWLIDNPKTMATKMPVAVEELLRFESTFSMTTWRFFSKDTYLGNYLVPAGDSVIVGLGAANRDPNKFPDPHTLNLQRTPNKHIAFGNGIHICPGAGLARMEIAIALEQLFSTYENIELDCEFSEIQFLQAPLARAVAQLPIRYRKK